MLQIVKSEIREINHDYHENLRLEPHNFYRFRLSFSALFDPFSHRFFQIY